MPAVIELQPAAGVRLVAAQSLSAVSLPWLQRQDWRKRLSNVRALKRLSKKPQGA